MQLHLITVNHRNPNKLVALKQWFSCFIFYVAGLDARGFLFGPLVSMNLNVPFLLVRKSGKLPGPTIKVSSTKEYGKVIIYFEFCFRHYVCLFIYTLELKIKSNNIKE